MAGGRGKVKKECFRIGYSFKILSSGVPEAELHVKSPHDSFFISDQTIQLFAAPSRSARHEGNHIENDEPYQELPLYFDPLLPTCRHNNSHTVPLRNLKKHEVRRRHVGLNTCTNIKNKKCLFTKCSSRDTAVPLQQHTIDVLPCKP